MRFVLVAAIWVVLVGGLSLYSYRRDLQKPPPVAGAAVNEAPGEAYTLEVTPSFATAADPFALRGDPSDAATVVVRLADRELYRSDKPLPAGVTQSLNPVPGLVFGHNEIYLKAVPPQGESTDHAVRVRLLQGGRVLLERTLSAKNGAVVAGTLPFELRGAGEVKHER